MPDISEIVKMDSMPIIDAHTHIGECRVFAIRQTPENLLTAMEEFGIAGAIVQPYPGSPDAGADHDRIAALAREFPGRFWGLASLNPHTDESAYQAEIGRCVTELGFVGVKLHSLGHAVSPGSPDAQLVFRAASTYNVPLMIHTGAGVPFAEPAAWMSMIRQYPGLQVVLGHAGAGMFSAAAIGVAAVCENVSLEMSWCSVGDVMAAVRQVGAGRVMFGSDDLPNVGPQLAHFRAADLTQAEQDQVFGGTARSVFRLV